MLSVRKTQKPSAAPSLAAFVPAMSRPSITTSGRRKYRGSSSRRSKSRSSVSAPGSNPLFLKAADLKLNTSRADSPPRSARSSSAEKRFLKKSRSWNAMPACESAALAVRQVPQPFHQYRSTLVAWRDSRGGARHCARGAADQFRGSPKHGSGSACTTPEPLALSLSKAVSSPFVLRLSKCGRRFAPSGARHRNRPLTLREPQGERASGVGGRRLHRWR